MINNPFTYSFSGYTLTLDFCHDGEEKFIFSADGKALTLIDVYFPVSKNHFLKGRTAFCLFTSRL